MMLRNREASPKQAQCPSCGSSRPHIPQPGAGREVCPSASPDALRWRRGRVLTGAERRDTSSDPAELSASLKLWFRRRRGLAVTGALHVTVHAGGGWALRALTSDAAALSQGLLCKMAVGSAPEVTGKSLSKRRLV
ncbi:hypothetical protein NDU88_000178 [Pleurodeles waltl]|uniref:Uncharacterized protein n=1 Tax=Pleurodeles waltl TaxID=8319 RepID=A0AAV7KLM8_PLEWA|nr:hypothetical protein NDU88_000178 [Pleurodeles waltl]